ncbi:prepilin-type N-terminal cleavage/methylation domain-containing protein [Pseudoduganella flava]|nr:prepilin-type N-terminal cleavage/methylation domain-containing protein [Pseudoduganella flava]QGZ42766.1 prepilin-type N-terminal cleavage/methylation domain-containing protein [Pseudoduganella flava]
MTAISPSRTSKLPGHRAGQFGFTLVELILVLVVTGILAAVMAPRFFDRATFDTTSYSNQVTALIRYGQKQAIAQNRNVFVRLDGASVALCYDAACTQPVTAAAGKNSDSANTLARCGNLSTWACEGVPNGLAMTAAAMFYFDPAGRPFYPNDGNTSTFVNRLAVQVTGGGQTRVTLVEQETGYTR